MSRRCRRNWVETKGVVKEFRFHYGTPHVLYEYCSGERVYHGRTITPCFSADFSSLYPLRSRKAYLHPDGNLKFLPGQEVQVFHDPSNPGKSALMPGFHMGLSACLIPLLITLNLWVFFNVELMEERREMLAPPMIFLIGVLLTIRHALRVGRALRSRKFTATKGVVRGKDAEAASNAFHVEYIVDGVPYRSAQIMNLPCWFLGLRSRHVSRFVNRLLFGDDQVHVFYDPTAPWDGFLQQLHPARVLIPFCAGVFLIMSAIWLSFKLS